jgi:hypothetical protein
MQRSSTAVAAYATSYNSMHGHMARAAWRVQLHCTGVLCVAGMWQLAVSRSCTTMLWKCGMQWCQRLSLVTLIAVCSVQSF